MAVRVKVTPFNLNFKYVAPKIFTKEAQTQLFAEFAQERIDDAKAQNARVLGSVPPYTVSVDGRLGAPLLSAKPNGIGVYVEFELVFEAVVFVGEMLERFSPVKSGRYQKSHVLIADGVVVEDGAPPPVARVYKYFNIQPYARRIERGWSSQAPDGVYQTVATLPEVKQKFGNVAKITFGYETPLFGAIDAWASSPAGVAWGKKKRKGAKGQAEWLRRQPAVIITL
jgi:hypothetical protein